MRREARAKREKIKNERVTEKKEGTQEREKGTKNDLEAQNKDLLADVRFHVRGIKVLGSLEVARAAGTRRRKREKAIGGEQWVQSGNKARQRSG